MLYQKLLGGERPYRVQVGAHSAFCEHRHPDLELSYCMEGQYKLRIGDAVYLMKQGDFAVIGSMAVHAYDAKGVGNLALNLEVGPAFLGEFFEAFARIGLRDPILRPEDGGELHALLEETARLGCGEEPFSELTVKGNLYKICSHILKNFPPDGKSARDLRGVASIERALGMIRTRYAEPLKLETVAAENGYRESNFCKVFKSITGETFHAALNRRRVEVACMLLADSNDAVESIAQQVGFCDAKSFCRVFKSTMGVTPNTYRKHIER
ncbi:MAG: helix-turn-helix transcriptional regulator [Clostridia bacterium]|nr:helix-turn-helix transcriptional regulator [Clostridia bacterium]